MRVLLDEQLPHRLRKHLGMHDVCTVDYMGWAGLKNGELLGVAEADGFYVFLAGDKKLTYQQNLAARRMAIVTPGVGARRARRTNNSPFMIVCGQST